MADKYIHLNNGIPTEKEAVISSTGAADAGKIPALDSSGRFDESMMPTGIAADTNAVLTSENLSAGDFVNIYDDAGTAKARKADASTAGKEAHGFVLDAVVSAANAVVYFEGTNSQISGATPGRVYLSATTPGGITPTPPTNAGNVVQQVGVATAATSMNVEVKQHYVLA
jgi:hypothetical protein